jgi:hypothetical protein
MLIAQANMRRAVADLLGAASDARCREMRDVLIHQCLAVGRDATPSARTAIGQLL